MKTHDMILSVLKQMESNQERKEFLNSIAFDKNIPKDDLRKITCKVFIEENFVDEYFKPTLTDIIKLKFKYFFDSCIKIFINLKNVVK